LTGKPEENLSNGIFGCFCDMFGEILPLEHVKAVVIENAGELPLSQITNQRKAIAISHIINPLPDKVVNISREVKYGSAVWKRKLTDILIFSKVSVL